MSSLPRYLFFDCFSLLNYENRSTTSSNLPAELERYLQDEFDKFNTLINEQWKFYLHQFDRQCFDCNFSTKQQSKMQQITSKSTINNGNCFKCKLYFSNCDFNNAILIMQF